MRLTLTAAAVALFTLASTSVYAGCSYKNHNQQSQPTSESTT